MEFSSPVGETEANISVNSVSLVIGSVEDVNGEELK